MLFIKETVWTPATVVIRKLSSVLILSADAEDSNDV